VLADHRRWAAAALVRGTALAGLWLLLAGAEGWPVAVPSVALAVAVSLRLRAPARLGLSLPGAVRFVGFLLYESLRGGLDVARRALSPASPAPGGVVELRSGLPAGAPRTLMAVAISLLPGTLCAAIEDDRVRLHCLDPEAPVQAELARLEARIAGLFAVSVRPPTPVGGGGGVAL